MAVSNSTPGKATIVHEAGDTLKRTIILKSGGSPINLYASKIEMFVKNEEDENVIAILSHGNGIIDSNVVNGEVQIFWQTTILQPKTKYPYKLQVTFPNGQVKTYLEDKIATT